MPTPVRPPTRGQPKRDPVDQLRTRVWYQLVKHRSGLPSAYAIEQALEPGAADAGEAGVNRPRKWDAYAKGARVPKATGEASSVTLAEARYPGTKACFESSLWEVLKRKKLQAHEIDHRLRSLAPAIQLVLADMIPTGRDLDRPMRAFDEHAAAALVALGTFDALVAAVLLIQRSECISSHALRERAFQAYYDLQARLCALPELSGTLASEVFRAIDTTCKHWVYPAPQLRLEVVFFSEALRADALVQQSPAAQAGELQGEPDSPAD